MEMDLEGANLDLSLEPLSTLPEPERVFTCIYCNRKFQTSQALGGHQNAHKLERSIKKTQEIAAVMQPPSGESSKAGQVSATDERNYVFGNVQRQKLGGVSQLEMSNKEEEEDKNADEIDLVLKL